jgi:hypothetical protein
MGRNGDSQPYPGYRMLNAYTSNSIAHSMVNSNSDEKFKEVQQQLISVTKLREEKTFEIVALKKSK